MFESRPTADTLPEVGPTADLLSGGASVMTFGLLPAEGAERLAKSCDMRG